MRKSEVINYLDKFNVRPSVQRIAIMDYLLSHENHPTVDMVYQALNRQIPTLSKTTVYNTLKVLAEAGAAQEITIDSQQVRYDARIIPHAHFHCKCCGKVVDLLEVPVMEPQISEVGGNRIDGIQYYFTGICETCLKKNNNN